MAKQVPKPVAAGLVQITAAIPQDLLESIDRLAAEDERSRSKVVERLLRSAVQAARTPRSGSLAA